MPWGWGDEEHEHHGHESHEHDEHIQLNRIEAKLDRALRREQRMAADLTALREAVEAEGSVENSVEALLIQLSAQIAELASQETVDPAELQALADQLNADTADLQAAVVANTPADTGSGTPNV